MRPHLTHACARIASVFARIAAVVVLGWFAMSTSFVNPAAAQGESVSAEFRTALEPYGSFRHVERWGDVWVPTVARDWKPYTVGRWVYSGDYGWYWVSEGDEASWGWVAFHYGRWVSIDDIGWAWIPGQDWSPAWTTWRRGGGHVGWAPLPPDDIVVGVRDDPSYWCFVRDQDFIAPRIATVIVTESPVVFLHQTVVVNETVVVRDRGFAVNPGIEPAYLAAAIGRPIPEAHVRPVVLAGTAQIQDAVQVRADDLRRDDFRRGIGQQTEIRDTNNVIRPAANVPPPQALAPNERGRFGQNPPRAAAQQPTQPGSATAPEQQQRERGAVGSTPQQQERGPTGPGQAGPGQEQQRGTGQRGPTGQEQQRGTGQRGPTGQEQQRGTSERGRTGPGQEQQRGTSERGRTGPGQEQQRGTSERGRTGPGQEQQRGTSQRGPTSPGQEQQRGAGQRGPTGLGQEQQRGAGQRGPTGPGQEQPRGAGQQRGPTGPGQEQQRGAGQRGPTGGPGQAQTGPAQQQRGATGNPTPQRGIYDRAAPNPAPQRGGASGPPPSGQQRGGMREREAPGGGGR
jgi:hypothetical protein